MKDAYSKESLNWDKGQSHSKYNDSARGSFWVKFRILAIKTINSMNSLMAQLNLHCQTFSFQK